MRKEYSHRSILAALILAASAGCAAQPRPPVDNPIADALVIQAHAVSSLAETCRSDAAAYRERSQTAGEACGGDLVLQVEMPANLADTQSRNGCATAMIAQISSCQRWDDAYQAMIAANEGDTARAHEEVEQMEVEELLRWH
ncbi:MAG: hypothetical protein ABSG46_06990 [Candidatus Binataceae bacterium]|jgi:hypothetical protein